MYFNPRKTLYSIVGIISFSEDNSKEKQIIVMKIVLKDTHQMREKSDYLDHHVRYDLSGSSS